MAERDTMDKHWYAIHTYTGQEEKVRTNIERRIKSSGIEHKISRVLVPVEEEMKMRSGKKRLVKRRVFPGYILVEMAMDDETWYFIRDTVGVTGFVGPSTRPVPLQPQEVENLLKNLGEDAPRAKSVWHKGEVVRVASGPFTDSTGKIEEINVKSEKLTVMISIFGRDTPVELNFAQVERL